MSKSTMRYDVFDSEGEMIYEGMSGAELADIFSIAPGTVERLAREGKAGEGGYFIEKHYKCEAATYDMPHKAKQAFVTRFGLEAFEQWTILNARYSTRGRKKKA